MKMDAKLLAALAGSGVTTCARRWRDRAVFAHERAWAALTLRGHRARVGASMRGQRVTLCGLTTGPCASACVARDYRARTLLARLGSLGRTRLGALRTASETAYCLADQLVFI